MVNYKYTPSAGNITDSTISTLKKRIGLMIGLSTLVVAAAFGLSFYFAFISNSSAIARQIPELAPVVDQLKSHLLMNTFGLLVIIIASILLLNKLIANRVFNNIGRIGKSMNEIAGGSLPERGSIDPNEGFSYISSAHNMMLSGLRKKEASEIERLGKCLEMSASGKNQELQELLGKMVKNKKIFLGIESGAEAEDKAGDSQNEKKDGIFLQPN
ncbi:MAG: hypothetical protein R6U43_05855 [Candidatus Krumholzibacteriales bacterium]